MFSFVFFIALDWAPAFAGVTRGAGVTKKILVTKEARVAEFCHSFVLRHSREGRNPDLWNKA